MTESGDNAGGLCQVPEGERNPQSTGNHVFPGRNRTFAVAAEQITIPEFDYEETDGDRMRVWADVRNDGDENQRVTLTIEVRAGDERNGKSTDLTVRANETTEAEAIFDVTVEEFEQDGSIDFDWDVESE